MVRLFFYFGEKRDSPKNKNTNSIGAGSGSDNFFDAGSCIDGRLTSAWNWCSQLEKKAFYPVFLLSGFMGFDGKFE